jgi:hypothetical protein
MNFTQQTTFRIVLSGLSYRIAFGIDTDVTEQHRTPVGGGGVELFKNRILPSY